MKKIVIPKTSGSQNSATSTSATASTQPTVGATCSDPKTIVKDGIVISTDPKIRGMEGLKHFIIGALLAVASFIFFYWVSHFFGIHWIFRSIVALAFSYLTIRAWDKATGEIPTLKTGAVANFTIMAFVISLLIGYHDNKVPVETPVTVIEAPVTAIESLSETLTLSSPNDFAVTKKKFQYGDNLKVKISGSAVKLNSTILTPSEGEYNIPVLGNDFVVFNGTSNVPATIEIYY